MGASRANRALTPEERIDARAALDVLAGSGLSLHAAAIKAIGRAPVDPVLVDAAVDRFLRRCLRRNLSAVTVADYNDKLNAFSNAFGARILESLTRPEILEWIGELPVRETTATSYRNVVGVFLNWATREDPPLLSANQIARVNREAPKRERSIDILTPDEAERIMAAAGKYAPTLALMLFAGTRPSEIRSAHKPPLLWNQVDAEGQIIRISAQQSKTRSARPLEGLPANIWTWLQKPGDPDEPIAPGRSRQAVVAAKSAIGRWSQDICRHSFFTYHLAAYGDISRTMLIAGHEDRPSTMYQHYRGVATEADAKRYFSITQAHT